MGHIQLTGYLLDTHAFVWALDAPSRLPKGVLRILRDKTKTCWLSPISLWEIGMLSHKKRLTVLPDLETWTERALERIPLREAPVTFEVAKRAERVIRLGDPADTLIAASAWFFDLTLLTADRRLQRVKGLRTQWREISRGFPFSGQEVVCLL